jgi:hypothetical protein
LAYRPLPDVVVTFGLTVITVPPPHQGWRTHLACRDEPHLGGAA